MIELGLSRIHRLLLRTPLPWRAIHVAGTNGKGSVCAYVSAMLDYYNTSNLRKHTAQEPLKHARYTSPHLVDRWDCITIDGKVVAKSMFDQVEAQVMGRNKEEAIGASEFEVLTATAFEIFTRAEVDIGVIEVGMGGRLDATNIIGQLPDDTPVAFRKSDDYRPSPLVTGITSIGLDHQKFLGTTIQDIAREKAGIMKPGVPVVAARQHSHLADQVLADTALSRATQSFTDVFEHTTWKDIWLENGELATSNMPERVDPIQTRWPNGALAVQLVWKSLAQLGRLEQASLAVRLETLKHICQLPHRTRWAGRLETVDLFPITGTRVDAILDGAHNAQSATMLRRFVDESRGHQSRHWIVAASQGKDVQEMLSILLSPGDAVSAVEFGPVDGMPWVSPMKSGEIAATAASVVPSIEDCRHYGDGALQTALCEASIAAGQQGRRVVIAGSLYLVGDVLRLLRLHEDEVQDRQR